MKVSNLVVLSVLSIIAAISFMSIPEVASESRAAGSSLVVNSEVVKRNLPSIATNSGQQG